MKTRLIAAVAAVMLTVTSLTALANAENADTSVSAQPAVSVTESTSRQDDNAVTLVDEATQPTLTVANVKTHHKYQDVAQRFKVRIGKVSNRTKVCLWSTDCRKAVTMVRRLAADETLTVVAQSKGWYKVVDSTGRTGFVVRSRMARA